ncbi:hypothetical protein Pla52o_35340 [Novipirellula galeiformis]|uniref:ERCC4 domain-containing protein n=1 Tax=Novipirellula galeiformis TaxID=2528004 RepID=A0A5C6CDY4_9BACT|nr:hypothetical protein [Novipirellula galeiformis]TWU22478.1 hypothetical protein Pla52o_35340 [Novipirellula galeiformis]
MSLEHLIAKARDHFKISEPSDWCEIRPEWIRNLHGVGPRTLDQIRCYLALRGLTLKDDATVEFWQRNLQTATIGGQISLVDTAKTEAFTILVDSQEKQPWTFQGFTDGDRPLIQPYVFKSLGPTHGDYSVAGCERYVHVERKSIDDALGTFLSHGDRQERWTRTLEFLAEIPHGSVVIEGTFAACIVAIKPRGTRSKSALINEFIGSVMSWQHTYGLQFWFLDTRRIAEKITHRLLKRGWRFATEQNSRRTVDVDELIKSLT